MKQMAADSIGTHGYQFVTDITEYPAEIGDVTKPRKAAFPVVSQSAIALLQGREASQRQQALGLMPDDWLLEKPGVGSCADLDLAEAQARLVIEKLFISSYNLVQTVSDHLVQKKVANLDCRTHAAELYKRDLFLEIDNLDQAKEKTNKAAHIGKIMTWVAVAVTAIACTAGKDLTTKEEQSPAATALCANALAVALLGKNGSMEDCFMQMAGLLKKMGFDEKTADLAAGIQIAVVAMAAIKALNIPVQEPCALSAIQTINDHIMRAAQLAAKDRETTEAAICITKRCNRVINSLLTNGTLSTDTELPVINTKTQSIKLQDGDPAASMKESSQNTGSIGEEMTRFVHDIMINTRQVIDQGM
jgi:hypothetical protein